MHKFNITNWEIKSKYIYTKVNSNIFIQWTKLVLVEFRQHNYLIVHLNNILANGHMMALDAAHETILDFLLV